MMRWRRHPTTETPWRWTMSETAAPDDALLADIEEAMRDVVDPELGINVVDLGLVYDLNVEKGEQGNVALIDMTLTSAACPLTDVIEAQSRTALVGAGRRVSDVRSRWLHCPTLRPVMFRHPSMTDPIRGFAPPCLFFLLQRPP